MIKQYSVPTVYIEKLRCWFRWDKQQWSRIQSSENVTQYALQGHPMEDAREEDPNS
jgi:hypothetical protein